MSIIRLTVAFLTALATAAPNINPAYYDGSCFYPLGDPNFPSNDLIQFTGRWYQVAGTFATFTLGCSCIYADYGLNVRCMPDDRS